MSWNSWFKITWVPIYDSEYSNDNKFHLRAFRHLYVLASESRLLLSKDVDTNEFCYVPIEITLKASQHHNVFKYQQMAPCILPELNRIQELQVLGPRYYPIKFKENIHFKDLKFILNSELFVKQKMAISVIRTILKMRKHLILGIFSTK